MKAADVMVSNVISVGSQASVQEVAEVLLRNRISGVPASGRKRTLASSVRATDEASGGGKSAVISGGSTF